MDRMGAPLREWEIEENPDLVHHDRGAERVQTCGSRLKPKLPRKASSEKHIRPYRKPTQVGREKSPKVDE